MKLKHFSYLFLILFISNTGGVYSQTVNKDFFDGEIYVKYNDDFAIDFSNQFVEPQSLIGLNEELVKEYGITQARFSFNKIPDIKLQRTVRIKCTELEKVDTLIKHFEQLPYIEYAEKVPVVYPTYTPNDFGLNKVNDVWHLHKIKATKAWDFTKGDTNITVAIVDQEVDIHHPDLKDNIWVNPNEIPNNGIDDDNNGYIDDIHGWDVSDDDNDPVNYNNHRLDHGTPCAGLVSATTNNNLGVASIGFSIRVIAVKACRDNQNNELISNSVEGIAYAANANANIISCSFGHNLFSTTTENAINFAFSKNCIVVASAGNDNNSVAHYPSDYQNVISVAASNINDVKAGFSNFSNSVTVIAPGVSVGTLNRNSQYRSFGGTSASCPLTAGLLGLMKSYMPVIKNDDLKQCLISSADDIYNINPNYVGKLGSGRINAEKALQCVDSVKKSPPIINISLSKNFICPNERIILKAESYKRPLDSAKWYIYKKDTTLVLKGLKTEVFFDSTGEYSIAMVGYDKYGKDSIYKDQYVQVNSFYTNVFFTENFENSIQNYSIVNADNGITWSETSTPKTNNSDNTALKIDFFNSTVIGQKDAIIFPSIDLRTALKPRLTFQFAYSLKNNFPANDSLTVYASTDSGKTFPHKIYTTSTVDLITSNSNSIGFRPTDNKDWCIINTNKCPNILLDSLAEKNNVVLKFEAYYGRGNNLYLDDIRVYANCGNIITAKPISSFTSIDSLICLGDSLQLAATSTSFPKEYKWILEGAVSDTLYGINPKTTYTQTGTFDVTLITSNVLGSDTIVKEDYVNVSNLPKVTVSDTLKYVCPKDSVFFTAWGTDSIIWQNTNTNKITIDSVIGDRPIQNTFYQAKAITKEGCFDTKTVEAILVPIPPAITLTQVIDSLRALHTSGNFSYRWYINDTFTNLYTTRTIKPYKTANYKVEIIDSAGCSSITNNFFVSTIGINELSLKGIKIYPNPASSELYINGVQPNSTITVIDILGKEVYTSTINGTSTTISISSFSKGLYLIKISQGEQSIIKKIIVE